MSKKILDGFKIRAVFQKMNPAGVSQKMGIKVLGKPRFPAVPLQLPFQVPPKSRFTVMLMSFVAKKGVPAQAGKLFQQLFQQDFRARIVRHPPGLFALGPSHQS